MATHKPFRELVKPGSNFEFVGRTKLWAMLSSAVIIASIGMLFVNKEVRGQYLNWTIDFKGGTELIFEFCDDNGDHVNNVGIGDVRSSLNSAGFSGFDVSDFSWEGDVKCGRDDESGASGSDKDEAEAGAVNNDESTTQIVRGLLVRTPDFGALTGTQAKELRAAFVEEMGAACVATHKNSPGYVEEDCLIHASWSGDRLFVRHSRPLAGAADEQSAAVAVRTFFSNREHDVKPGESGWVSKLDEGIGEYSTEITIYGLDRQFTKAMSEGLGGARPRLINLYGVGAKAGAQLRNDGIKSLFYALALIVLYLAFRFDIRYAPGAVVALVHDAILVVGVFALTYTDVSLTSVAALLTVIGYSVNDTVVIFDRIRENIGRLKDKKLARIVNISLNETLSRTLLTSITLFVVTVMMNIFGTGLVRNFAFAMNIGVVVGVYSSVFVASPILLWVDQRFYPPKGPTKGEGKVKAKKKSAKKSKD